MVAATQLFTNSSTEVVAVVEQHGIRSAHSQKAEKKRWPGAHCGCQGWNVISAGAWRYRTLKVARWSVNTAAG